MEVHRVDMRRVLGVGKIDFHRIADPYTDEGAGNLIVEGPVFIGAAAGQLTDDFGRFKIHRKRLGAALAHRLADRGGILGNIQRIAFYDFLRFAHDELRSEEHTSELQSLMRISYAVFCLKNKTTQSTRTPNYVS